MDYDRESQTFLLNTKEQTLLGLARRQAVWRMRDAPELSILTMEAQDRLSDYTAQNFEHLAQSHQLAAILEESRQTLRGIASVLAESITIDEWSIESLPDA